MAQGLLTRFFPPGELQRGELPADIHTFNQSSWGGKRISAFASSQPCVVRLWKPHTAKQTYPAPPRLIQSSIIQSSITGADNPAPSSPAWRNTLNTGQRSEDTDCTCTPSVKIRTERRGDNHACIAWTQLQHFSKENRIHRPQTTRQLLNKPSGPVRQGICKAPTWIENWEEVKQNRRGKNTQKALQMQYEVLHPLCQFWALRFSEEFLVLRLTQWGYIFVLVANWKPLFLSTSPPKHLFLSSCLRLPFIKSS